MIDKTETTRYFREYRGGNGWNNSEEWWRTGPSAGHGYDTPSEAATEQLSERLTAAESRVVQVTTTVVQRVVAGL